ncbi:hypothetical protein [Rhodococcus erythropolis]|uniref:hypothetical protein n=1 Tax=Rhodococcus erythropolis TaxID=1833 RepID=UPI0036736107
MATVHVRANQTTVDWVAGETMTVERTAFVDSLIRNGALTDLDESVTFAEGGIVDAQANLADSQANAAAAQENLTEARTGAADTLAELNTELDNEPPKRSRSRKRPA